MSKDKDTIFVNRRHNSRRTEPDPCNDMDMDLYHRKRRKSSERRNKNRSLADDYYAFTENGNPDKALEGEAEIE